ncbi:chloride channel protein [Edwardsiella piscicida]|nr:chloride channel protein [Edwardsiella piscicida]UCQ22829.1 chloride channel protein [Edwardsiella piscicida]WAM46460.1 chloride channel protein [Edwardsiella piscicida]
MMGRWAVTVRKRGDVFGWRRWGRFTLAMLLTGGTAGVAGWLVALLLHSVQHLAYGYSLDAIISRESFLQGVSDAAPWRRFTALMAAGGVAGVGWYALYRYGRGLVSVRDALRTPASRMPTWESMLHAALQVMTVGMGSPLGRESAPREMGALGAERLAFALGITPPQTRTLIACGAGAGLAAVYNVPVAGALFTLEVLLKSWRARAVIPALVCCTVATLVARIGLGDEYQYSMPGYRVTEGLLLWSLLFGPLFGGAGVLFARLGRLAESHSTRDVRLIRDNLLAFLLLALLSLWLPQLPGNGKGATWLSFNSDVGIGLAGLLLCAKVAVQMAALRAGARGGLMTPALANGALLACIVGSLWLKLWPGTALGAFAVVGAGAFLSASMGMPLTALLLVFELTHISPDFLLPMLLAIVGATAARRLLGP